MSYIETSIIEANYNDRMNKENPSNNFTVKVPPRILKKGSQISISGAVVKEVSANNDSVIELSNLNVSDTQPYKSSWASIDIRYYMNNNGLNSVVHPFIQTNYVSCKEYNIGSNILIQPYVLFPTSSSYVQRHDTYSLAIIYLSGPTANTNASHDYDFSLASIQLRSHVDYIYFDGSIETLSGKYGSFVRKDHLQLPHPFDAFNQLGEGAILNYECLNGAVGIRTALKKNMPDSSKYSYIKPGYTGPSVLDTSEESGIPDIELFINNIEIDLKNDLMESAEELTLKINEQLKGLNVNDPDNIVNVEAKFRQWSTDYYQNVDNDDGLYPKNSTKTLFNISSKTLINIPANFRTKDNTRHQIYGESFFVKDSERWIHGNNYFKINNRETKMMDGNYHRVYGIDPSVLKSVQINGVDVDYLPDFSYCMRNASAGDIAKSKDFPSNISFFIYNNFYIFEQFSYEDSIQWNFTTSEIPSDLPVPNNYPHNGYNNLLFYTNNPDTSLIRTHNYEICYGLEWETEVNGNPVNTVYVVKQGDKNGNLILEIYPGHIVNQRFEQNGNERLFYIDCDANNCFNKQTLNFYDKDDIVYSIINSNINTGASINLVFSSGSSGIGLPYFNIVGNTGGGQYCNDGQNTDPIVNEYLCIPKYFVIPMNIICYNGPDKTYLNSTLDRIKNFFRNNETYEGTETDPLKIEADVENWFIDLDVGFADDFNNAYSNYLSSKGKSHSSDDTIDYTIYDEQQNFSVYPKYYPNMMSNKQYDIAEPGTNGYNFRRQLTIYPISRYARMGTNGYETNQNYIKVFSRFSQNIINSVTGTNVHMPCNFNLGQKASRLHPAIKIRNKDKYIYQYCQNNNIPLVGIDYIPNQESGDNIMCIGFINYQDTGQGSFDGEMSYDDKGQTGRRTCFRICTSCNIGFDPTSTTNPFMSAMNRDQSVPTNPDYYTSELYTKRSNEVTNPAANAEPNLEIGLYTYGTDTNPIYSVRIEDYVNNIWLGAVDPQITYNNGRMNFNQLYTPRMFNANDAIDPSDPNIGNVIASINDDTRFFCCLNYSIGSVPDSGPNSTSGPATNNNNVPARGQPGFFQIIRNKGISDSISGIGIQDIYVKNELESEIYKCEIDLLGNTKYYKGSLFDLFGFDLRQLKPLFGRSYNRYSTTTYNKTNSAIMYKGINYFTLNSYFDQTNCQKLNIFGDNFNTIDPSPLPPNYYPQSMRAQAEFLNSYVGFQRINLQVSSDELRAERLASKLQQAFYKICCNLPSGSYITNNNALNCISYFYRQYKNANFYFVYSTGRQITLTDDYLLTNINTQILNENNRPAEHIGESATIFYKITEQKQLNQLTQDDYKNYQANLNQPNELRQASGKPYIGNLNKYQLGQQNAIFNRPSRNSTTQYNNAIINENGYVLGSTVNEAGIALPSEINMDDIQMIPSVEEQETKEEESGIIPIFNAQDLIQIEYFYNMEVEQAQEEGRKALSKTAVTTDLINRGLIRPFNESIAEIIGRTSPVTAEEAYLARTRNVEIIDEDPNLIEAARRMEIENAPPILVKPDEDNEDEDVAAAVIDDDENDPGANIDVPIATPSAYSAFPIEPVRRERDAPVETVLNEAEILVEEDIGDLQDYFGEMTPTPYAQETEQIEMPHFDMSNINYDEMESEEEYQN